MYVFNNKDHLQGAKGLKDLRGHMSSFINSMIRSSILYLFLLWAGVLIVSGSNLKSEILKMRIKLSGWIVEKKKKKALNSEITFQVIKGYSVVIKKLGQIWTKSEWFFHSPK